MKEQLKRLLLEAGACDAGVCGARIYTELIPATEKKTGIFAGEASERINPFLILPGARSVLTFVVTYKSSAKGNISQYARGSDYHGVLRGIARPAEEKLRKEGFCTKFFSDTGALFDRHLAYLSGLGFFGKNHCLIHPRFGSFVFIGAILTDCPLPEDSPIKDTCKGCGKCIKACPSGALGSGDFSRCLSCITQKKEELTEEEAELIKKSPLIWGCDICQEVCPHNDGVPDATLPAFSEDTICMLTLPEDISNREFKRRYGDRAFSWRGKNVLLRNMRLKRN